MANFIPFKTTGSFGVRNQKLISAVFLTAILLIAAFLRLYRIGDYMTFLGDEGRDAIVVYNILHGQFTLLGPASSVGGFFLGPIYYYFMAPFLYLSNYDPAGPAVMVALFGVATVFLLYMVASEFLGKTAGFVAALLYAISPLIIAYSRSSWNPNPLPFFSILTLYLLYKGVKKNKWFFFVISGISYGVMLQLHYVALFVGAVIIVYVILARLFFYEGKKFIAKVGRIVQDGFFLLIGTIIGFSPFLVFELRHGFPNLIHMTQFILSSEGTGLNSGERQALWDLIFRLYARLLVAYPPVEQLSINSNFTISLFTFPIVIPIVYVNIFVIFLILSTLSLLFVSFRVALKTKKNRHYFLLLIVWLFVGLSFFLFYKKNIHDYYFGFLYAIPFILTGFLLSFLYWNKHKAGKIVAVVILLILLICSLNGIPFRSTANRQKEQVKLIADFVLDKTNGKPFNFALLTLGNSDHGYRYFFKLAGRDPVVIQTVEKDPKRSSATDQLLIVCEDPNCKPLGHPLWEVAGFGRAEIVGEWPVSVVKVYKLKHYLGDQQASSSAQ